MSVCTKSSVASVAATPLVSIGLPVYNGENFLAQSLESVLQQSYTNIEVIVCDNCSTDGTEQIVRSLAAADPRVRYERNETNLGASRNFNRSFELAKGKYFKWMSHDDVLHEGYIRACVDSLESDPALVLCSSSVGYLDANGERCGVDEVVMTCLDDASAAKRFNEQITIDHKCYDVFGIIRREILGLTPLIGSYITSDRNLLAELALHGRFGRIPEILYEFRMHDQRSVSVSRYDRAEWFDSRLKGKKVLPHWRMVHEYLRSVLRTPGGLSEKSMQLWMVACCGLSNHRWLRGDILRYIGIKRAKRK